VSALCPQSCSRHQYKVASGRKHRVAVVRCWQKEAASENPILRPTRGADMPLVRLKDLYLLHDGVRFLMVDDEGSTVICRVSHEALRDHADRLHLAATDDAVFEEYRELIEDVASEAFDAEGPFDEHGRILVTSEALARVTRSA
jgi:Protein of unknown function (DUF1488)